MNESVLHEIEQVVRRVFQDPLLSVTRETTAADIDGWDSMSHIILVTEIEKKFNIRFSTQILISLNDLGHMCDAIMELQKNDN